MTPNVDEKEPIALRPLLWRLALGLFTFLALLVAAGWLVREPIEVAAVTFVKMGPIGLAAAVLTMDLLPLTHEPMLLLAWSGGMNFPTIWVASSIGSVIAGLLSWRAGVLVGKVKMVARVIDRFRLAELLAKYGLWAVALAALTPLPYGATCWAAGAARVPFVTVLLGCLFRFVKVAIYLALIVFGWSVSD